MAFWSSEKLKDRANKETLITPYYDRKVKHGAYELSLGNEAFITSTDNAKKQALADQEQLVIPPGQLALLITKEEICIPADAIGFISIKAGIKFSGLVNVSGFHVDPGFSGKLKFSVYNAGSRSTVLTKDQSVFLLWFSDLDRKTADLYKGEHANQKEITSQDVMKLQGEVHSPAALDQRLIDLEKTYDKRMAAIENWLSTIKTIGMTIAGGFVLAALVFIANHFWDSNRTSAISPPHPPSESKPEPSSGGIKKDSSIDHKTEIILETMPNERLAPTNEVGTRSQPQKAEESNRIPSKVERTDSQSMTSGNQTDGNKTSKPAK